MYFKEILKFENGLAATACVVAVAAVVVVTVVVTVVFVAASAWAGATKGAAARPLTKNRLKLLRM
ncbi:hypothetical protein [Nonomuraea sp. NPDC001699]